MAQTPGEGSPSGADLPPLTPGEVLVVSRPERKFAHELRTERHTLIADEPVKVGGNDEGPSPYDLLLMALGACTSMTIKMYAARKGWPLEDVRVTLRHERLHAADCEDCEANAPRLERISRRLELKGDLSEVQRQRLVEIAEKCPVHRTLTSDVRILTVLAGENESAAGA